MVVVTGATGLLGSHVLIELLRSNCTIRATYRDKSTVIRVEKLILKVDPNLIVAFRQSIEWVQLDLLDLTDVDDLLIGSDVIIHCAALVSFYRRDFNALFEQNRQVTFNLINAALAQKTPPRVIYVSSVAAIGTEGNLDGIKRETNSWNPTVKASGYAMSKFAAEKEVWRGIEEGLNAVIINPTVIFGAGNWEQSSLKIFKQVAAGLTWYTPGSNAFVDARDVARLILRLKDSSVSAERFIISGTHSSFKEVVEKIAHELNVKAPNRKAGKQLLAFAWRLDWVISKIRGKRPTLTKEMVQSALGTTRYSQDKLMQQFPDFKCYTLEESIKYAVENRI